MVAWFDERQSADAQALSGGSGNVELAINATASMAASHRVRFALNRAFIVVVRARTQLRKGLNRSVPANGDAVQSKVSI